MHSIDICFEVISAAEEIHAALGPRLFRETYTVCLAMELINRGFQVQTKRARMSPDGVDRIYVNEALRIDISGVDISPEDAAGEAVRVRKGTSDPIAISFNFNASQLIAPEVKQDLFSQIVSIADVSAFRNNRLQ